MRAADDSAKVMKLTGEALSSSEDHRLTFRIFWSGSSTDQGGGKRPNGTSGSGYFQAAQAKLIDRLGTRVSFILGVHGDLGRQIAELIADLPAALV